MITYWMWKSVNKKHLDEIVVVMIITPIMLITDIFTFPLEIIGLIFYLIFKEVNMENEVKTQTEEEVEIYGEVEGDEENEKGSKEQA